MPKKVAQVPFIQSLDRGITILQTVAMSRQPVTLGELSELLGVDRSSAFRLAQTLRRRGFCRLQLDGRTTFSARRCGRSRASMTGATCWSEWRTKN